MSLFWVDLHSLREDVRLLSSLTEHLAVCIIPVHLPSGRQTLERALGTVWEMFPFVNWHRQPLCTLSAGTTLCGAPARAGGAGLHETHRLGPQAQCLYRRSELLRTTVTDVAISRTFLLHSAAPYSKISLSRKIFVNPRLVQCLAYCEHSVIGY